MDLHIILTTNFPFEECCTSRISIHASLPFFQKKMNILRFYTTIVLRFYVAQFTSVAIRNLVNQNEVAILKIKRMYDRIGDFSEKK